MGPSLGGMVVLAYGAMFPQRRAAARLYLRHRGGRAVRIALRSIQREAITADPDWKGGAYTDEKPPVTGSASRASSAPITYRSAAEWQQRFGRAADPGRHGEHGPFSSEFAIQGYLERWRAPWTSAFDAELLPLHFARHGSLRARRHGGRSRCSALAGLEIERALVIGVQSDLLFAVAEQRALADMLYRAGCRPRFRRCRALRDTTRFWWTWKTLGARSARFSQNLP